jgi:KaiC/GvpD/RAD55 family RecA-like ATPase
MLGVIRFGIPSLDGLFGDSSTGESGIHLPRQKPAPRSLDAHHGAAEDNLLSSVSLCITGPGGTGKSILGMHLASRYLADCRRARDQAVKVFYVSTDLKHQVAHSVWERFGLDRPNQRQIPFTAPTLDAQKDLRIALLPCHPLQSPEAEEGGTPLSHHLVHTETREAQVYFVDLASNTAGDDWGFVSRVLSVVERTGKSLPHLMIIDSVEGFETLVGERDAFGESQPRRSRVAQILRAAGDKCHIVFIIEEPKEGEHLPEEFVTDVVIRLRSFMFRDYGRRTIEIEKSRGQAHVRGQHIILIRSGAGSTTGRWMNHDDPEIRPGGEHQSYVHICPSLHHLNRRTMILRGEGLPLNEPPKYAAFGIRYLDEMLAAKIEDFQRDGKGDDQRGLPCRTTTALIGNSQTQKSPLGHAFLCRCFRSYAEEFARIVAALEGNSEEVRRILEKAEAHASGAPRLGSPEEWRSTILRRLREINVGDIVLAAALSLGPPQEERDGVPVLLTTHDQNTEMLSKTFIPWLLRKVPALSATPHCVEALELLMQERTICRRLEIHDMPSAVLIHIVQRSVETAQRFLFQGDLPDTTEKRFRRSWGIRVVIDDMSILRQTYAEVRDDPLLLRCLVFLLGREGVTTLLIDTQEGHPHLTVPNPSDSELRSLVYGHIYTWRFPFYDGNRVAIAAIPSMRPQAKAVIRELREGTGKGSGPEAAPLVVDPHFELYSGIETGKPKPIPLLILLYEEMPAFRTYICEQNKRCGNLFTPLDGAESGAIIAGMPEYQRLFDFVSNQRDTLLEHALVFQVDEFWMMRRPGIRRSGASRPVWDYLYAKTSMENPLPHGDGSERIWAVDPFGWFQRTLLDPASPGKSAHRRADDFVVHGYTLMDPRIDRVPFMWDFGFLLCRIRAWEDPQNNDRSLKFLHKGSNPERHQFQCVADVWKRMPKATKEDASKPVERPSWRVFLEACYLLARAQTYATSLPIQAFDLHVSARPGLSCLILEIWASEIFERTDPAERQELVDLVSRRDWKDTEGGLIELLERYPLELFRTWLLLVEVLDLKGLASAIAEGQPGSVEAKPSSIAVRHWYKSAWATTQDRSVDDPVVPAGLPGHFSVRGDWFLAVAGGSRSERLADQALDFLNTRRSNYDRLRCGMGLPVRRIVTDQLRTGIMTLDRGDKTRLRVSSVHYENLIRLGGPVEGLTSPADPAVRESFAPKDFHWFWRSRLHQFARHTRIWHDWLWQTIVWWNRIREVDKDSWLNGFERYDQMINKSAAQDELLAWKLFRERCNHLIRELRDAALA